MKRRPLLVATCLLMAMLLGSCYGDLFDFSELEEVHAEGQWNLPIGTVGVGLDNLLDQLAENDLVTYDAEGNLQITYHYVMDTVLMGRDFMSVNDMSYDVEWSVENPHPEVLPEPMNDVIHLEQNVELDSDAFRIMSAKIRSGKFFFMMKSSLSTIQKIVVKSPSITNADGTPFEREAVLDGVTEVDVAGVQLDAAELNTLKFIYDIYYVAYDYTEPSFPFEGNITVNNLCIQELSGYVNSYGTTFSIDSAFKLPIENVNGEIQFVEAQLSLWDRNSFNVEGSLRIDTAMLHGGPNPPTHIFESYPVTLDVNYTPEYNLFFDRVLNLGMNTEFDSLCIAGEVVFNPNGLDYLVTLQDTSTIGIKADIVLPLKFNIPNVTYTDTIDMNVSEIEAPEMIQHVLLYVDFVSELPFNISAQLFTIDPETHLISDSLFTDYQNIEGSFNGRPVKTEKTVMVTHDLLSHVMQSDKLYLKLGVDTDGNDVQLNLEDKLKVTLKADVLYDGNVNDLGL